MSQTQTSTPAESASTGIPVPGAVAEAGPDREFLTFRLGEEEYGVDILKVQEIRSYDTVTKLPAAPSFIKGVINLRGTIVPIVDMRLRFDLEARYDEFTVMIMLNVNERVVGLVVDGVSDVMTLSQEQIRPAPEVSSETLDTRFVTGLGAVEDRLLILVDIEGLMGSEGMALTAQINESAPVSH